MIYTGLKDTLVPHPDRQLCNWKHPNGKPSGQVRLTNVSVIGECGLIIVVVYTWNCYIKHPRLQGPPHTVVPVSMRKRSSQLQLNLLATLTRSGVRGNSIVVSISVCQVGRPGSSPVQSACFRKVVCYQNVIYLSPPVPTTDSPKSVHVLLCLCNNACKRSLAICKSRALCPVRRLLSVPIWPAYVKQGR